MSTTPPTTHTLKDGRIITIRCALAADAAQTLQFDKRILLDNDFAGPEADEINQSVEEKASWIEKHRNNHGHLWLVAEHDGQIVGTINLWNGDTRRTAHVGTFGIGLDHDWRGRREHGLATAHKNTQTAGVASGHTSFPLKGTEPREPV